MLLVLFLAQAGLASAAPPPAAGVWLTTAPPPAPPGCGGAQACAPAAATLLGDGTVLVRGGRYDPATDTWRAIATPARVGGGATQTLLADGRVLFVGGYTLTPTPDERTATATLYDPATDAWSPAASLAAPRIGQTATRLPDGAVLAISATSDVPMRTIAERYNPATDTWSAAAAPAYGHFAHTATLLSDGRVLLVGGVTGTPAELFDPATNTWSPTGVPQVGRTNHPATLLPDGRVLIIGGQAIGPPPQPASPPSERFDPATGAWTALAALPEPRVLPAAMTLADGTILVVGGYGGGYFPSALAWRYDPAGDRWLPAYGLRAKANAPALARLPGGGVLAVLDGYAERYIPDRPAPRFSDVPETHPAYEAIAQLAGRGIVQGYGDGRFGPGDPLLRAQAAALIARGVAWDGERHENPFPDQGATDDELWRAVAALAAHHVVEGYPNDGPPWRLFDPNGPVLKIQVVSLVTRAQVNRGYWPGTPPHNGVYPNVPQDTHARGDLEEFVARAGALPDAPDPAQPWADWDQPATREWTARVIWQAFSVPGGASR